ncbi:MAG: M48 family metalloprotease [Candidatus Velthaea sp.]
MGTTYRVGSKARGRMWTGAAAGMVLGYGAIRTWDAYRQMREPAPPLERPDPAAYAAARRALSLAGTARSIASMGLTAFLLADPLERAVQRVPGALRAPAFISALALIDTLRDLPVDFVEAYGLERAFGTSEQSARSWLADHGKATAVGVGVSAVLGALGEALVRRAPRAWPWLAIGTTPILLTLANVIAPTYVMPLFNEYTALEGSLERNIRELAARYGVGDAAILRFDMSRQTKKANAFVTGVFGTKRIALADTLIEKFPEDETLFVVAHELGHYVRKDPWVSIVLGTAFLAVTIVLANAALRASGRSFRTAADGARFAFYGTVISTLGSPLMLAASRAIERRADEFAVQATHDPRSGARAFRRLRDQNLAEEEAPKWAELLLSSHPSLRSRIERLESIAN